MSNKTIGEALQSGIQDMQDGRVTIGFQEFVVSACIVVMHEADFLLSTDFGMIYTMGGEKVHEERAVELPTVADVQRLIYGVDFLKSSMLVARIGNFLRWLMKQEAVCEDEELWYMPEHMAELYNQFVLEQ